MVPALRLLLAFLAIGSCIAADHIDLWPMPKSVIHGTQRLYVSKDLAMSMEGSKYSDGKAILKDAFQRTVDLLKLNHAADGANPSSYVLTGVNIAVHSPEDELNFGVDESYNLTIHTVGEPLHAQIENVLHWHIVDEQSFPIEIPSYPKLWNGSYSYSERYTMSDAVDIVRYAEKRGVNVLAEIDVPGHALSWGVGYPSLWPSDSCKEPLDVSNNFTFTVIDGILSDFSKVFKFKFVHLGGDEVNTSCWTATPHIKEWLNDNHMNVSDAYRYFVLRTQKIAISHGYDVVNWEETFNHFGEKLDRKTVVHNWLGGDVAPKVVAAGLRCIVSNQDKWYLDHLDATWEGFYMNEPLKGIDDPEQQGLVIGGEVCMWGEQIDASDIEQTIWPRAAAAAERLWTPIEKLAEDARSATSRLSRFRCLLNQRGVAAAPLAGDGRTAPYEPGPCVRQ
ncbi:hypothetical protein ACQ4PT_062513 [Festuca glaucescens]